MQRSIVWLARPSHKQRGSDELVNLFRHPPRTGWVWNVFSITPGQHGIGDRPCCDNTSGSWKALHPWCYGKNTTLNDFTGDSGGAPRSEMLPDVVRRASDLEWGVSTVIVICLIFEGCASESHSISIMSIKPQILTSSIYIFNGIQFLENLASSLLLGYSRGQYSINATPLDH